MNLLCCLQLQLKVCIRLWRPWAHPGYVINDSWWFGRASKGKTTNNIAFFQYLWVNKSSLLSFLPSSQASLTADEFTSQVYSSDREYIVILWKWTVNLLLCSNAQNVLIITKRNYGVRHKQQFSSMFFFFLNLVTIMLLWSLLLAGIIAISV